MNTKVIAIAATLALSLGSEAIAATGAPQITIETSGYDLGSAAGQAQLDRSVRIAAHKVCTADSQRDTLQVQRLERQCFATALNGAREQLAALMNKDVYGKNTMVALSTPRKVGSPKN